MHLSGKHKISKNQQYSENKRISTKTTKYEEGQLKENSRQQKEKNSRKQQLTDKNEKMSIVGKIKLQTSAGLRDLLRPVRSAQVYPDRIIESLVHNCPLSLGQRHGKDRLRLQICIDHFPFRLTILRFVSTILHRIILHLDIYSRNLSHVFSLQALDSGHPVVLAH